MQAFDCKNWTSGNNLFNEFQTYVQEQNHQIEVINIRSDAILSQVFDLIENQSLLTHFSFICLVNDSHSYSPIYDIAEPLKLLEEFIEQYPSCQELNFTIRCNNTKSKKDLELAIKLVSEYAGNASGVKSLADSILTRTDLLVNVVLEGWTHKHNCSASIPILNSIYLANQFLKLDLSKKKTLTPQDMLFSLEHVNKLLDKLAVNTYLREIDLSKCQLKKNTLARLTEYAVDHHRLTHLELGDNFSDDVIAKIADKYLVNFQANTHLLVCNPLQKYAKINRILKINQLLADSVTKELNELKDLYLDQPRVENLLKKLSNNSRSLIINTCELTLEAMPYLMTYLENQVTIEKLCIQNCLLSDEHMAILSRSLLKMPVLMALFVDKNSITNQGLKEIIKVLQYPSTKVMMLDLSLNKLDNEGLKLLADCLSSQLSLTALDLQGNNAITGAGLTSLANSLCQNKVLRRLYLPYEAIDKVAAREFIKTLAPKEKRKPRNKALIDLSLCGWEPIPAKQRLSQKNRTPLKWWSDFQTAHVINEDNQHYLEDYVNLSKTTFLADNKNAADKLLSVTKVKDLEKALEFASLYSCRDFVKQDDGASLLHIAVSNQSDEIINHLLRQNFIRGIRNKANKTALDLAQEQNNQALIQALTQSPSQALSTQNKLSARDKKRKRDENSNTVDGNPPTVNQPKVKKQKKEAQKQETQAIAESIIETTSLSQQLILALAAGQVHVLKLLLKSDHLLLMDEQGRTLMHHAVVYGQAACADYLYAVAPNPLALINAEDKTGETALLAAIKSSANGIAKEQYQSYLAMVWWLIEKGANPNISISDDHIGREKLSALHFAVIYENYGLMKIILASPQCNINQIDSGHWNVLDWAIHKRNPMLLSRLLIDRRLTHVTLIETKEFFEQQLNENLTDKVLSEMLAMVEQRRQSFYPEAATAGVQWMKRFSVVFGSHYAKPNRKLVINSEKQHSYLMTQNLFAQNRIYNSPQDNQDIAGNPVTASLVFFVSTGAYQPGASLPRQKIRINLDFIPAYHIAKSDDEVTPEEEMDRVCHRISAVNHEIIEDKQHTSKHLKDLDATRSLFDEQTEENNKLFARLFRHGEQALLDYLEQEKTIAKIVNRLMQHPKFIQGSKIYGLILELHSPRYLCDNCEIAILGEQNATRSKFLQGLSGQLQKRGCTIPRYNYLRMLTQVSSYISFPTARQQQETDNHIDATIDFRSCQNNLIMAKDLAVFSEKAEATQFHSTKNLA